MYTVLVIILFFHVHQRTVNTFMNVCVYSTSNTVFWYKVKFISLYINHPSVIYNGRRKAKNVKEQDLIMCRVTIIES